MANKIRRIYLSELNKGLSSKFRVGTQVRHETPEGARNIVSIAMKTIVRIFLEMKIIKLHFRKLDE